MEMKGIIFLKNILHKSEDEDPEFNYRDKHLWLLHISLDRILT